MKKYLIIALFIIMGLMAVTAMCLAAGWLPEWEILFIAGVVLYVIILRGWFIDPEEIENFWENNRSGK